MPEAPAKKASGPALARFSAEEMKTLLHVIKNSKSIEIKVSVPMSAHFGLGKTFGFDPVEAEPRQVYFFDTADQTLNRAGLVLTKSLIGVGSAKIDTTNGGPNPEQTLPPAP